MAGRRFAARVGCVLLLTLARSASAAWPTDPAVNLPVCTATGDQSNIAGVPDGAGGVILTWHDPRGGTLDIFAQRISASGAVLWTADGVAISAAPDGQYLPAIVADGAGGAIITWIDLRGGADLDIYAQKVSADGKVQWAADGVALCSAAGTQHSPAIVPDGDGGAIVCWEDYRGGNGDIYSQRISSSGAPQWQAGGLPLCELPGSQQMPALATDGAGGAIAAWWDARNGEYDIYGQAVARAGATLWTANGVALCTAPGNQLASAIAPDSVGGAIVAWEDFRAGPLPSVYAQRVSPGGRVRWHPNGVALGGGATAQLLPRLVADGAGGAIVTWADKRNGNFDIFCQRISPGGILLWAAGGAELSVMPFAQLSPAIVTDDAGGAIVTWSDARNANIPDVYAQKIAADGSPLWAPGGIAVSSAARAQYLPCIAPDGAHGAFVSWYDFRSGAGYDLFAQRVQSDGQLGGGVAGVPGPESGIALALDRPHPNPWRSASLRVGFTLPGSAPASLELLDAAGRRIAGHEVGAMGAGHHVLDLDDHHRLAPGIYLVRLHQGGGNCVRRVAVMR